MMYVAEQEPGSVDLQHTRHRSIQTLEDLRAAAQLVIQVEMTTIPAYLTAMYSIQDRQSDAYQTLRSVVMEEMFHINQAANILIGVGGQPRFTGKAVPRYPTYLPAANKECTPYVGLYPASPTVIRNVFMAIETPAAYAAPPEDHAYQTIGQLYAALEDGIAKCVEKFGEAKVFHPAELARQRVDTYLGKFGGQPLEVTSTKTARDAIRMIVSQGEGAVTVHGTLIATQPYGAYHHYGPRPDGTYGPILGVPNEESHYVKFLQIANAANFPDVYPVISNPRMADYPENSAAHKKAIAFNKVFSLMLQTLEQSFQRHPGGVDPYFQITLPLMHQNMAAIARDLMATSIREPASVLVGPNATPTFEYDPAHTVDEVIAALEDARDSATDPAIYDDIGLREQPKPRVGPRALSRVISDFEHLRTRAAITGFPV